MTAPVTMPSGWRIGLAISHAAELRDTLLADPDFAFDADLLRDTLDGETDAINTLRRVVRFVLDTEAMADAVKARMTDLAARRARYDRRAENGRATAMAMMDALGMKALPDAEFTASISAGRPSVVITEPALVPDAYEQTERKINKADIGAALKAGQDVAGAMLSNAVPTLTIRSK